MVLNDDVLLFMMTFLSIADLLSMRMVSRRFSYLATCVLKDRDDYLMPEEISSEEEFNRRVEKLWKDDAFRCAKEDLKDSLGTFNIFPKFPYYVDPSCNPSELCAAYLNHEEIVIKVTDVLEKDMILSQHISNKSRPITEICAVHYMRSPGWYCYILAKKSNGTSVLYIYDIAEEEVEVIALRDNVQVPSSAVIVRDTRRLFILDGPGLMKCNKVVEYIDLFRSPIPDSMSISTNKYFADTFRVFDNGYMLIIEPGLHISIQKMLSFSYRCMMMMISCISIEDLVDTPLKFIHFDRYLWLSFKNETKKSWSLLVFKVDDDAAEEDSVTLTPLKFSRNDLTESPRFYRDSNNTVLYVWISEEESYVFHS